MYNKCFKIHMIKQQAADFKLVFVLMEIINFEATWILNAIKIECSIFEDEVRFYDAYYIKIIFSYIYQFIYTADSCLSVCIITFLRLIIPPSFAFGYKPSFMPDIYFCYLHPSLKSKSSVPACSENIQSFITGVLFDM